MKIRTHVYSSAVLGSVVYALTQSVQMAASSVVSGVLIDIDHVFDFLVFSGETFTVKNFLSWCYDMRWRKVTIFFHSYEACLVLGMITFFYPNPILAGVLMGGAMHLILDQIGNPNYGVRSPMFYFFTYRCAVGFKKDRLFHRLPFSKEGKAS